MRLDVHQHLWTPPLLDALAERDRCRSSDGWTGSRSCSCGRRAALRRSTPPRSRGPPRAASCAPTGSIARSWRSAARSGSRRSPATRPQPLIDAHLDGVLALGDRFGAWGPLGARRIPTPMTSTTCSRRGCVGVSLPACALAGATRCAAWARCSSASPRTVVRRCSCTPGRGPGRGAPRRRSTSRLWWPALTDYVAQMQAAWLAFAAAGRREHPEAGDRVRDAGRRRAAAGRAPGHSRRPADRPARPAAPSMTPRATGRGPSRPWRVGWRSRAARLRLGPSGRAEPLRTGRERELQENAARLLAAGGACRHEPAPLPSSSDLPAELAADARALAPPRPPRGRTLRVYEQIWDDEHVNAWLICWSEDQDTGFHDHDESGGRRSR